MKDYFVHVITTGCFSGTLNPNKLTMTLKDYAKKGWRLSKTIKEEKRVLLLFNREAHFLIFEREVDGEVPSIADAGTVQARKVYGKNSGAYIGTLVDDTGSHYIVRKDDGSEEKFVDSTVEIREE